MYSHVQPPKLVLSEEALIAFETQELNIEWYTNVVTAFLPQCDSVLLCYLRWEQKELLSRQHRISFFKRGDRTKSTKEPEPVPSNQAWVKLQLALHHQLLTIGCTISHLLSPVLSVILYACSHDDSPCVPAVVLYYCIFQSTVRFSSVAQSCPALCNPMD